MTAPTQDRTGVALRFKVPFRFRQWFKLMALRRNLAMTEFLIAAVERYSQTELDQLPTKPADTDLRK